MSFDRKNIFEELRKRHLLAIFIAGAVQSLTILVFILFSSNVEGGYITKALPPGFALTFVVLFVHYMGPAWFLGDLRAYLAAAARKVPGPELMKLARRAQDNLLDLPARLARWTAGWWVFAGLVLMASAAFLPGVISYWWELLLIVVLAGLGGVFGYLFIYYATKESVRVVAGEVMALDTGFHVERQSEPIRGVGRKLLSSFLSLNLAGSLILLTLLYLQAGAGERLEKVEVLKRIAARWEEKAGQGQGGDEFGVVKEAAQLLGRDLLVVSDQGDLKFSGLGTAFSAADAKILKEKLAAGKFAPGQEFSVRVDSSREYILIPVSQGQGPAVFIGQLYSWSGLRGGKMGAFIVCLAFVVLTGLLVTQVVRLSTRDLLTPVTSLLEGARQVAGGDISQKFTIVSDDEIGSLAAGMKIMVENLRDIAERIRASYQKVDSVVGELRQSSGQVAASSAEQREKIQTTVQSISRLHEVDREVSDQAAELGDAIGRGGKRIEELMVLASETAGAMEELKSAVETTSSSILEMSASLKQIAHNTNELMERSEDTSSMMIEMEASIKEVEGSSRETKAIAEEVIAHAGAGVEAVQSTIAGIGLIQDSVGEAQTTIQLLVERTTRIGKILKVITDVTNQTNLLALNAAIISAQAGEYGKGFSVVADEIKSLADRTAESTAEIDTIIAEVRSGAAAAARAMNQGYQQVEDGVNRSFVAGEALEKIQKSVQRSFAMVDRITQATGEQVQSARRAMEQTEAIAGLIQQITSATREQAKGGDLVMAAADHISKIAGAVKQRTDQQTLAADQARDVMAGLKKLIGVFNKSHEMEKEVSAKVTEAMTRIRETARSNDESVTRLDHNIASLEQQAEILASVIDQFKIE
jgi:methyl-accepting chemotaxis protein